MDIKDIQANCGNIDVTCDVVRKDSVREFEKFGKVGKVCNATLADATGEITFSLWNEDIEKYNVGDKLHITGGWCSEFKGNKQLSAGKYGKVEIVGKATIAPSASGTAGSSSGSSSSTSAVGGSTGSAGSFGANRGQRDLFSTPAAGSSSGYGGSRASSFKYNIDDDIELLTPHAKAKPTAEIPKKKVYDPYDDGDEKVRSEELDEEPEEAAHDTDEEYVE